MLSQFNFFIPSVRYKAIGPTNEENWHVVSLLQTYRPVLYTRVRATYERTWHLESCFWNVLPSLTKQCVENMNKVHGEVFQPSFRYTSLLRTNAYCHLESFLKLPTPRLARKQCAQNCSTYEESDQLTCRVFFICPLNPTKQQIQHMDEVDILSRCYEFDPRFPYRTPRSTCEATWHLESCFTCAFLPDNKILNKRRACIWSHFWNLAAPDPTKQYIQHMKQIDMSSCSWDLPSPDPRKRKGSTYEENWHVFFPKQVCRFTCMGFVVLFKRLRA